MERGGVGLTRVARDLSPMQPPMTYGRTACRRGWLVVRRMSGNVGAHSNGVRNFHWPAGIAATPCDCLRLSASVFAASAARTRGRRVSPAEVPDAIGPVHL
eukprot:4202796-Prymnesium_polylepis.2